MTTKNILKLTFLVATYAVLLHSCGSNTSKKQKSPNNSPSQSALVGEWKRSCAEHNWLHLPIYDAQNRKFDLLGNFTSESKIYTSQDCSKIDAQLLVEGTASDLGKSSKPPEARDINYTILKVTLTPLSEFSVKTMNDLSYCGIET